MNAELQNQPLKEEKAEDEECFPKTSMGLNFDYLLLNLVVFGNICHEVVSYFLHCVFYTYSRFVYSDLKDKTPGGGASMYVIHGTPMEQQNGGFQKKLVKEEDPDDDYLCKTPGHTSVQVIFSC